MVMIMLKMNRMSKLLNSLALVAALTVSTAVYAMEQEDPKAEDSKITVTKQSFVIVNEELMEKARSIAREKVLENLYDYSKYYFRENNEMVVQVKSSVAKINKVQYDRNIYYFNEAFLSHPFCVPTFNRDILAFLKHGTTPIYCNYEGALFGVAQVLNKAGITLEALVGKTDAVEEVVKEESTPS
jgi:hypothetical protein